MDVNAMRSTASSNNDTNDGDREMKRANGGENTEDTMDKSMIENKWNTWYRAGDPLQATKYALKHIKFRNTVGVSKCRECNSAYKFLKEVSTDVRETNEPLKKNLTGTAFKFEQFMGHKVRAKTQESRTKELFEWWRREVFGKESFFHQF